MENKNSVHKYSGNSVYDKEGELLPIEKRSFTTKEGYTCILTDYGTKPGYVTCCILDYSFEAIVSNIRRGTVKYPFHASVYGNGFIGVGPFSRKSHEKVYETWRGIIERVYSLKLHTGRPTYKDVTVCKEWLNLQNFGKWMESSNYKDGWELDKDLLSGDSKIYSPETCIFIPPELNTFLATKYSNNASGYIGVYWHKRQCRWIAQTSCVTTGSKQYLGAFLDIEDAAKAYKLGRECQVEVWVTKMSNILPDTALQNIK